MFQILMVVIAAVLMAVTLGAGISYVNFDAGRRLAATQSASAGFQAWERAYTAYRIANRAAPLDAADLAPFLPAGGLRTPPGMAFGFGRDAAGPFVCLAGEVGSEDDLMALLRLGDPAFKASAVPASALSYGPACGGTGVVAAGAPLAVTFRLAN